MFDCMIVSAIVCGLYVDIYMCYVCKCELSFIPIQGSHVTAILACFIIPNYLRILLFQICILFLEVPRKFTYYYFESPLSYTF